MDSQPMNRVQFSETLPNGFSNRSASGKLPNPLPSPLFLNLGCGRDVREGFVNIDLFSDDPRVVGMDIRRLALPDDCADGIIASDVLEHFSHRETQAILREWVRVLKPGGELVIRCPSLKLQCKAYTSGVWSADVASYMIFGGQTNPGDYHCVGFDETSIRKHIAAVGLDVFQVEEEDTPQTKGFINLNMTVRAGKPVRYSYVPPATEKTSSAKAIHSTFTPSSAKTAPQVHIVWEGSQFVTHSLALINREQCSNLIDSGVADVTIVPYEHDDFSPKGNPKFEKLQEHDVRFKAEPSGSARNLPVVWVRHQWPPQFQPPKGAKWIVVQPWEFSTVRKDFIEAFKQADEVWTPSNYSRRAFVNSGLNFNKVQVIPNGINPNVFTPFGDAPELPTKKRFKFLFIGGTIFRKGIDVLLSAYARAFTAADDVCLIIKDMGGDSFYKGQTAEKTIAEFRRNPNAPEIIYTDAKIPEAQFAELYRACDVYVSPYRGEGFSLPTLEAMASGLPVIVSKGGGTDDFVDEEVGWQIPTTLRSVGANLDGHPMTGEAFVLEPDVNALLDAMKEAYSQPAIGIQKGIVACLRARTQWTWNKASLKVLSRLDALYGTDMAIKAQERLQDSRDGITAFCEGDAAQTLGDIDTAITRYQEALRLRGLPKRYALLLLHRLAIMAISNEDFDLAEEFLDKSREIMPGHPDSAYIQSIIFAHHGEWENALDLLEPLLQHWHSFAFDSALGVALDAILCDIGRALSSVKNFNDARDFYQKAVEINPANADACYGLGVCFATLGFPKEAKVSFESALKLRPSFPDAQAELDAL